MNARTAYLPIGCNRMRAARLLWLFVGLLGAWFGLAAGKCCEVCSNGLSKYYSIAKDIKGNTNCGECCMDPADYELYLKFEPNLLPANVTDLCYEYGFPNYIETETHGAGPIKMTLDMYTGKSLNAAV